MSGMTMMGYSGHLLLIGLAANVVLCCALLMRLVVVRAPGGSGPAMEAGHVMMAAGMAYMFAPAGWQRLSAPAVAVFYVGVAVFFLAYNAGPACFHRSVRYCCVLMIAESLAMAYMFAFTSWGSSGLTNAFQLLFAGVVIVAAGRALLRGRVPLPAGVSGMTLASRLVMGSGMLTMLLLARPM